MQAARRKLLLGDNLGSTAYTADPLLGRRWTSLRYVATLRAWGEQRYAEGAAPTEFHFTGQRELSVLGLHFYGARWYDSLLGRWVQPDTVVPLESQGVQAWDRYAYVNNNPVRYNDPTGHCIDGITTLACITVIGMAAGALIGGGIDAYNQYQETGQVDVEQVAEAALAGAVVGGGLVIGAAVAGTVATAGAAALAGASTVACADGDCKNEVQTMATSTTSAIQSYYPPNLGFSGSPQVTTLQPGDQVSRYGSTSGSFLSPVGTPSWARALPPGTENLKLNTYEVVKPIENVLSGTAASWWWYSILYRDTTWTECSKIIRLWLFETTLKFVMR